MGSKITFKNIKIISLLLIFLFLSFERAEGLGQDKVTHFGVAAMMHASCTALAVTMTNTRLSSTVGCFVMVNALGAVKEATDPMRGGQREGADMLSNLAGSGVSFTAISLPF